MHIYIVFVFVCVVCMAYIPLLVALSATCVGGHEWHSSRHVGSMCTLLQCNYGNSILIYFRKLSP